ncbi:MAG: DUF4129 domain-containing protein [Candidatus Heimdallarchaeota archaeon]|nr:MAG: DUF4129 domain-containing protein [Candidatus Heimdallarchaeota archaeon]
MHQEKKVISKKSIITIKHTAVGFKVNTKDFDFVLRKEFLILCLLLLTVTFTQVSLGQMSGIIKNPPFLTLNFILFEVLGVILPVFSGIYIYLNYRKKHNHPWFFLIQSIGVLVIGFLIIAAIIGATIQEEEGEEEPIIPSYNATTIPTDTTPYTETLETQQKTESTQPISPPVNLVDFSDFFQSLSIFFLIFLFFAPLLFMLIIKRRSKDVGIDFEETETILEDEQENQFKMRTVLECYYQASTALEERGADSSLNFTPTEFSQDVVKKTLTSPPLIENLTNVFEEVKFSDHAISDQQVDLAKSLTMKIIFSSDSTHENKVDEEIED